MIGDETMCHETKLATQTSLDVGVSYSLYWLTCNLSRNMFSIGNVLYGR